ncbi:hypothetical protein D6C79_10162 [Aureobasidium pullulans]|nr:hypothetical protein D6C79_10162 [Aureobasidium pullulans]
MDNLPVAVAYAALRAQIRREFEEHMKRDNRPVTVMTSAGLVTLLGYLNARSRNSHICTMVAISNGMMAAC